LVALLDRRERWHPWTTDQLEKLPLPWITCEAVLTESWHLLRARPDVQDRLLEWVVEGILKVVFSLSEEVNAVRVLREKFRDVPMSLADACLVRLAEMFPQSSVLTLDTDFHVYRKNGADPIPLIFPED